MRFMDAGTNVDPLLVAYSWLSECERVHHLAFIHHAVRNLTATDCINAFKKAVS